MLVKQSKTSRKTSTENFLDSEEKSVAGKLCRGFPDRRAAKRQNSDSGMPDCRAMLFITPVFTKPFIP